VKNLLRLMLALALVLLILPVWAAETPGDDEDEGDGESDGGFVEYVEATATALPKSNSIATKLTMPLQKTPANVGAVGPALIYEQNAEVLSDVLQNISGLNIQNGSGTGEFFAIRGFDSVSSGLVMTDGAAEPEVSYYQTYNVQGVEVFKGPAGFLYGKNPLSGAVNVVRKQPLPGSFTAFQGSVGSFDTQEGTIDWNQSTADDRVSFRLNGLWQESEHYRDAMDSEHIGVNPSLTFRPSANSTLNVNFEHVSADYSPDNGIPLVDGALPNVSRRRSYQSSGDFSEQTLNKVQVDFETRLNDTVTLRNKTYYRELDWQSDGSLFFGTDDIGFGEQVFRDLAVLDDNQQFVGNQFEAIFSLESGSVQHELLVGLEVTEEADKYTFDIDSIPDVLVADPSLEIPDFVPFEFESAGDVTNEIIAPYIVNQMTFSERLQVVLGARYDNIDVEGAAMPLSPTGLGAFGSYTRDDSELSPMGGVVFSPSPQLSIYAHAAQSFAPPSTRLESEFFPSAREPERGTQVELGVKQRLVGGRVRTNFAVYELNRDRIAITGLNGFTQQSADQRSRGVEVELAAEMRPGLRTFFSYAYNDAELTDFAPCLLPDGMGGCTLPADFTGNTPRMAPEQLANLWVSKTFGNGFGVSGGARFVDEQFIFEDNAYTLDSSVVLNGAIFYDTESWRFKVNFKNITDEEYETVGIAGPASVIPADPFAAYASVEFRLP
jgi:TonB-dependent siderophore receptor